MNSILFPENIRIPSGKKATLKEMKDYGVKLQKFIRDTETKLEKEKNVKRYNDAVDYLNHIAKHYNHELNLFKQREQQRQKALMREFIRRSA